MEEEEREEEKKEGRERTRRKGRRKRGRRGRGRKRREKERRRVSDGRGRGRTGGVSVGWFSASGCVCQCRRQLVQCVRVSASVVIPLRVGCPVVCPVWLVCVVVWCVVSQVSRWCRRRGVSASVLVLASGVLVSCIR